MERVGALLQGLEGADVLRRRLAEARALERWPEIVGSRLAERTRPARLAGGRLFVVCHGAALRQELSFHKRDILRRFHEVLGISGAAREIVLVESDARLRPLLVERDEPRPAAPRAEPPDEPAPADAGERSAEAGMADAYPAFDGAARREELARIAAEAALRRNPAEERDRPERSSPHAREKTWPK